MFNIKMRFILLLFFIVSVRYIQAQQDTILLNEVEVKSYRDEHVPYKIEHITPLSIEQSSLNDVGEIIRSIPNISGIKKGAVGVDPVMRGFKYSQLNVLIDGAVKIEGGCPNRMDPTAAHVDIKDLLEINVLKGPFALKYGPSFGGVINMITWRPVFYNKYQTHIKGIVGLQSNGTGYKSNIDVTGGNRLFTYQMAAGAKSYGDYRDGDARWVKASMMSYHAKANLGFRIKKKHFVDTGIDGSFGRNVDFPALSMDEREDNTLVYKLNYVGMNLSEVINFVKVKAWLSDVHHLMDNKSRPFSDTVVAVSTIDATDGGVRGAVNINLGGGVLEAGVDYEQILKDGQRVKSMIKQPGIPVKVEPIWSNATISNIGIYGEYQISYKTIDWIVAGRVDFNNADSDPVIIKGINELQIFENENRESSFTNISANAGFMWHINNKYHFSFSLGRGVRSADITERFIILLPVGYDNFDYLGDPQLKPEINNETDFGITFISKKQHNIKANLFFSYVTGFIGSVKVPPSMVRPQTKGVLGVKQFVNFSNVWLTGFELSYVSPKQNPWQLKLNAAYTYGINPETVGYIIEGGQISDEYALYNDPLPEIPPFEINALFQYRFFNDRLFSMINWRIVAAQKHISQSYGENDSKPFQTIDIKLKYAFNKNLTLWAGVNNLFDVTYYEHLNRNIIGSSLPLYEPGRNFYINFIIDF